MPYNGSGVFTRAHDWTDDAAAAIDIDASRMDEEDDGFATGLSNCITKDGQTTITANIPFSGRKITGYGSTSAPSARTDVPAVGNVQDGGFVWVDGGGTADAITATYAPALTTLPDGIELRVRATGANTVTNPTFSPNGLTARTIYKSGGSALAVGDIAGDNHELILRYNLGSTRWELLNPAVNQIPFTAASASAAASLDFAEDTDNGSHKVTVTAPASVASDATITLPGVTATLATLDGTETLSNKTLASNTVATTQSAGDNSTKLATTAYADAAAPAAASQAQMEAASSTSVMVTPGRAQYHPGAAKAWLVYNGSTNTILASHNVSSVTDNATGDYTVNFTTAFSSGNYAVVGMCTWPTAVSYVVQFDNSVAPTTTACRINVVNSGSGALADVALITVIFFGDQ